MDIAKTNNENVDISGDADDERRYDLNVREDSVVGLWR